jgi:dolichol-phosphate mannosyltransferase
MSEIDLSVVIPAYAEEDNLRVIVPRLLHVVRGIGLAFEVLVVDSQAPLDNTREVCELAGIETIHCPRIGGNNYGDAVRTGIARARGRLVLFMDADGSHGPEFIPRLLEYADTHDVVIASRYVEGGATENPPSLILMSRILNGLYSVVLGLPCRDVSNSFKLYQGDQLRKLVLKSSHFDIIEEVLIRCVVAKPDLSIKEVPFVFEARKFGTTKRNLAKFVVSFSMTLLKLLYIRLEARRRV